MTIFETLIGESGTTAGNHRRMLSDVAGVPGGQGCIPPAPGCAVRRQARRRWGCVGAAGSAVSGVAGARLHCCEPWWLACARGGPGDLAGRKTGWVFNEGRLPGLVKATARTHAEESVL